MSKQTLEIEISAPHWAVGTGAVGYIDEVTEGRKVGRRVYEILQANKIRSTYYQDDRKGISKGQNVNHLIAHHNADSNGFVTSIHFNASTGKTNAGIGVEVLYANSAHKKVAGDLALAISKASGLKNRGAKKVDDIGILTRTNEPAVLIEVCFVNSKKDCELYKANFERICMAIAVVLANRVGMTIKAQNINESAENTSPSPSTPQTLFRIQSGTYATKEAMENAIAKADRLGILSSKWTTRHSNASGHYFVTGTYNSRALAENAIAKMKKNKILWVATVIK